MNFVEKMMAIGLSTGFAGFIGLSIYFSVENWNNYNYYKALVEKQMARNERNSRSDRNDPP